MAETKWPMKPKIFTLWPFTEKNVQIWGLTSLAVKCLRLHASIAEGTIFIPGQGTKVLYAAWHGQKIEEKKKCFQCADLFMGLVLLGINLGIVTTELCPLHLRNWFIYL